MYEVSLETFHTKVGYENTKKLCIIPRSKHSLNLLNNLKSYKLNLC